MGLYDPWRADMVAVNGEVAGGPALNYMHSRMKESSEGRLILKERPRITTKTVDYDALAALPEASSRRIRDQRTRPEWHSTLIYRHQNHRHPILLISTIGRQFKFSPHS